MFNVMVSRRLLPMLTATALLMLGSSSTGSTEPRSSEIGAKKAAVPKAIVVRAIGKERTGGMASPDERVLSPKRADTNPGVHPELQPGELFLDGGIGAIVPEPGAWVAGLFLFKEAPEQEVVISTDLLGLVTIFNEGVEESDGPGPQGRPLDPQDPCQDNAGNPHTWYWSQGFHWRFNIGSTPTEITQANAEDGIRDATDNITHEFNDCGRGDFVSATQTYDGTTSTGVNISVGGVCLTPDGTSIAGFGDFTDSSNIAGTCIWGNGVPDPVGPADQSDVRFNKGDYNWVVNIGGGCANKQSLRAIGTHERGHTFGIDHVSGSSHPALTMRSPAGTSTICSEGLATLGLGDYVGLEVKY